MRWLGMLLASGLASSALASFNLMLVLDSGQNVVHRYDGDTGVYLGNFGSGSLSGVRGIGVDKATGTAYVTHLNGYSGWDYNTGIFKFFNSLASGTFGDVTVTSDNRLLLTGGMANAIACRRMSTLTQGAVGTSLNTTGTVGPYTSMVEGAAGNYFVVNAANGQVTRFDQTNASVISLTTVAQLINSSRGDSDGSAYISLRQDGQASRLFFGSSGVTFGFIPDNPFTSAVEFEAGHPGEGWGLGVNASGTRLQRYFRTSGGTGSFYDPLGPGRTLSQVTTPAGLAVVTAPEPGTMLALGAGAVALLRRRRRR